MSFADPISVLAKLDKQGSLLDDLATKLADTERKLEPLREKIEEAESDFLAGLWEECEQSGKKLPGEEMRSVLAKRSIDKELRLAYTRLLGSRGRLERRLKHLTTEVDIQRSILSALKAELQASQ